MLYKVESGFVISSRGVWLPGCYEDERTARYAFRFSDETLQRLQDDANARAGGAGGRYHLGRSGPREATLSIVRLE